MHSVCVFKTESVCSKGKIISQEIIWKRKCCVSLKNIVQDCLEFLLVPKIIKTELISQQIIVCMCVCVCVCVCMCEDNSCENKNVCVHVHVCL